MSFLVAAAVTVAVHVRLPFPEDDPLLQLIGAQRPDLFLGLKGIYIALSFTSPYIVTSTALSLVYIFLVRKDVGTVRGQLPPYVDPTKRDDLYVVVGEVHHPKKPVSVARPDWLVIARRGLFSGLAIFGATGTGKTSCCMVPFTEQILAYQAADPVRRVSGLVLEVKGDFCHKVREILARYGRADDYLEMSLDSEDRYNPLHNELEAYALAYGIASLLNNLFGKGKEPFWQQAYTNLVKFIILLHKVVYDYVTLFDVYECAINPDLLERRIEEGRRLFRETSYVMIHPDAFLDHENLEDLPFEMDPEANRLKAPRTDDLIQELDRRQIPYETQTETGRSEVAGKTHKQDQVEAVERWFFYDWMRIEPKLRTSIVEGISVFPSLFDDNPAVKRTFCPPKECYDPEVNSDGRYGRPMPPFSELIEQGKICALNFPVSANPGLARAIGTFLKQDFQRAVFESHS